MVGTKSPHVSYEGGLCETEWKNGRRVIMLNFLCQSKGAAHEQASNTLYQFFRFRESKSRCHSAWTECLSARMDSNRLGELWEDEEQQDIEL
jgi:hypothetical protein